MIAGLLLAAGAARRFGSQKLVVGLDGQPIVRHAAVHLVPAVDSLVIVVGASARAVRAALNGVDAKVVENVDWAQGLATSIRAGIRALPHDAEAVVIALGDEPRLDPDVIRRVVADWRARRAPIVTARYRGTRAHPVLFDRSMFEELSRLDGDAGARPLFEAHADQVAYVDVDTERPRDIDTPPDLERLGE